MPLRHAPRSPSVALLLLLLCALSTPLQANTPTPPALMLARDLGTTPIDVPAYFVSEKLDGVRARWDGRALWTRGGHRIATPPGFVQGWPDTPMDGELWIARNRFDVVSGIARSTRPDPAAWEAVRFMVFDLPAHPGPFAERVAAMRTLVAQTAHPQLRMVEQNRVASRAALDARLAQVVAAGGEGLMLHHADARYGVGRSNALLKLKPHDDAEARVLAHAPGKGKYTGMLGALVVEHHDGRQFRIGTGFTDAQRADPPPLGSWVTYRYNGLTSTGLPRFTRFLRIRDDMPP
ncbi:DNA ligase [Luteimonas fraxinea]|uniref:DNA ligase n=1 Tax=Luteimonas fraxinea TaxID=2901869 RepID=A0ABS8UDA1_9GAMM|nr:DNA ligase [Luteimonas fraxinea]MCD9097453.1 DNA ligase [Luteimonas fraxinea]UHH11708.1 DNA ligase [Luteimonas fraxinea]